jgi:hypothetical protein
VGRPGIVATLASLQYQPRCSTNTVQHIVYLSETGNLVTTKIFFDALELLEALPTQPPRSAADLILRLRSSLPEADPRQISLAVETFLARKTAPEKLGEWSREGYFSKSLLEQASRAAIARCRAALFTGLSHVLEVGTGTGSDTAALARVVGHVTTIDGDPVASELARRNLTLQGISNVTFLVGNAHEVVPSLEQTFDGFFADPARRTPKGERVKSGEDYSPPLSYLLSLEIGRVRALKISPGLFVEPPPSGWSRQFVGFQSECLEQTLWFGAGVPDSSVLLADSNISWAPQKGTNAASMFEVNESLTGYLLEAHGAVNRSQHVRDLFAERGAVMIAADVAYAIADTRPATSPLLKAYRVVKAFPFNSKRLRREIAALGYSNRTELKKRNFSGDLEQIRSDLKLPPHSHTSPFGVLFFFRQGSSPWVVITERCCDE